MKKALVLAAVTTVAMLAGSTETAQADHGYCSPYRRSYSSFGYSGYSFRPSYSYSRGYSFSPGYHSYSRFARPSYGFSYARPGFSISIGRGNSSFGFGRSRSYGHSHYHRHPHFGHRH
ncbi:MAG: hypothetical protein ACYTGL_22280 [Planctomycetota bacterium]|jgi:hypothetical protein